MLLSVRPCEGVLLCRPSISQLVFLVLRLVLALSGVWSDGVMPVLGLLVIGARLLDVTSGVRCWRVGACR